jgi:hypothetical protein
MKYRQTDICSKKINNRHLKNKDTFNDYYKRKTLDYPKLNIKVHRRSALKTITWLPN